MGRIITVTNKESPTKGNVDYYKRNPEMYSPEKIDKENWLPAETREDIKGQIEDYIYSNKPALFNKLRLGEFRQRRIEAAIKKVAAKVSPRRRPTISVNKPVVTHVIRKEKPKSATQKILSRVMKRADYLYWDKGTISRNQALKMAWQQEKTARNRRERK